MPRAPTRTTLFRKYALIFGALSGLSLFVSGLLGISYSYEESRRTLIELQREKADAAATRIGEYLFGIEQKIALTAVSGRGADALEQRRREIRLLRQTPAIAEITLLDSQGRESMRAARRAAEVLDGGTDYSTTEHFQRIKSGRTYRSPVYSRESGLFMTTAMAVGPRDAGITVAEIDLEFLLDGISRIKVGESGHAYAVDASGHLIAHPDIGLVLRNTSFAHLPQVQAAIGGNGVKSGPLAKARNVEGEDVLTAYGTIPQLGWFVFVEEPLSEAYRPLYAQAIRSMVLVLLGTLLALLAAVALVRRMTDPIEALRHGAARIGQGALDHRIDVSTGDELEELADEFNHMAERLQESYAHLERKVEERTHELEELNGRLAALSATDGLTGIANRRRFDEVLASEWSCAARTGQPLALGMMDIDWFKIYNDHYGHQAGDDCLRRVAGVLADHVCRTGDLVARYGGEEFVFIAPATTADSALAMATRIGEALRELALPHELSRYGCVTASIGVAAVVPRESSTPEELVSAADKAMYRAKALGRNQAVPG